MDEASLRTLLRDAQALARYALRNGRLPAGSKIFELIGALDAVPRPTNEAAIVAQLYTEMDGLIKVVDPARFKLSFWSQSLISHVRGLAPTAPTFFALLTLMLTFYLAFQSSQLHQADTALRAYEEWVAQQPREKLYAAFKMYRFEHVLNVGEPPPPLTKLDAYQKLVEDGHQLAGKGAAIQGLLKEAANLYYVPLLGQVAGALGAKGIETFINTLNGIPEVAENLKEEEGPNGPEDKKCENEYARTSPKSAKRPPPLSNGDINAYENSWDCFLIRLGVDETQLEYSPWPVIYQTRSKVNMLVTWLLPGLYGLLGACVYVMRDMMLSRNDRLGADKSMLNALSGLLRIALGGLAGIIIGWFWVPASMNSGTPAPPISSMPFGIAFLAGFSIETLFSLLDRLKTVVTSDEKKP